MQTQATDTTESIFTNDDREHAKQIADTTIDQLGGRRMILMTGAKHFVYDPARPGRLTFKLPTRTGNPWNYVEVNLTANDDYTISFFRVSTRNYKLTIKPGPVHEGIYCDQLRPIFEKVTGLYTSLR